MRFNPKCLVYLAPALCVGCATSWDGKVERWGSLREVLRNGETQGRVTLSELRERPELVGLGVLEGLSGEVTMIGDKLWVSTVGKSKLQTKTVGANDATQAAFLVSARVTAWREWTLEEDMNLEALEAYLEPVLSESSLSQLDTVPFLVKGSFKALEAHVVNGGCPFAADEALRKEPVREERSEVIGTLVGFRTSLPPGTLTHHGSRLHVHVALEDQAPYAGHLDSVVIAKGSRVLLPYKD